MRISDFIGSRVLSLSGARICGVIAGVHVSSDLKRIKAAEVHGIDLAALLDALNALTDKA